MSGGQTKGSRSDSLVKLEEMKLQFPAISGGQTNKDLKQIG